MLALLYLLVVSAALLAIACHAAWARDRSGAAAFGCAAGLILLMLWLTKLSSGQGVPSAVLQYGMLLVVIVLLCEALILNRKRDI